MCQPVLPLRRAKRTLRNWKPKDSRYIVFSFYKKRHAISKRFFKIHVSKGSQEIWFFRACARLILNTYCEPFPFWNITGIFTHSKHFKFACCLGGFCLRIAITLPKCGFFCSYHTHTVFLNYALMCTQKVVVLSMFQIFHLDYIAKCKSKEEKRRTERQREICHYFSLPIFPSL